jgi:hypothetical protein
VGRGRLVGVDVSFPHVDGAVDGTDTVSNSLMFLVAASSTAESVLARMVDGQVACA